MYKQKRDGVCVLGRLMKVVNVQTVEAFDTDGSMKVGQLIELGFLLSPVEFRSPVLC